MIEGNYLNNTIGFISSETNFNITLGGLFLFGNGTQVIRNFQNLIPHFKISIFVDFYGLDIWDNYSFNIYIDDKEVVSDVFKYSKPMNDFQDLIGRPGFLDNFKKYYILENHFSENLMVKFNSSITSSINEASWGINNFRLSLILCYPSCFTCDNESFNACKSCYVNAYLSSSGECFCDPGFYFEAYPCEKSPCYRCSICNKGCRECTNGVNCTSCLANYYFLSKNGACVIDCPNNMLKYNTQCVLECPNNYSNYELNCMEKCPINMVNFFENKTCIEKCPSNHFLWNNTCYLKCPDHLFAFNETCVEECPQNFTFNNKSFCDCIENYSLTPQNQCFLTCPAGYFSDAYLCKECHTDCFTCFGPQKNQCLSCYSSYFLFQNDSTCYKNCPTHYYGDNSTKNCLDCSSYCEICLKKNECLSCQQNYSLIDYKCVIAIEIKPQLLDYNNPLIFIVVLNQKWKYFMNNYQKIFQNISIDHLILSNDYEYNYFNVSDSQIFLKFKFQKSFLKNENNLKIFLNGGESIGDFYFYINQNLTKSLNSFSICEKDFYYYSTGNFF